MTISLTEVGDVSALEQCIQSCKVSCGNCRLNSICLPQALESGEFEALGNIIQHHKAIKKNRHLYQEGEKFRSVYVLRTGVVKAYRTTDNGLQQIIRFYYPGEVLGMDGICNNFHASSAESLEMASVCQIPFKSLQKLSTVMPNLQHHVFRLMSRQITEDQQLITLLSKNSAVVRVASLILSISIGNARRKLSATHLCLPMTRIDIGNYLGLTVETVSREFGRLKKMGILQVDNCEIEILDTAELRNLVKAYKPCGKSHCAMS
jgi:CRP/FNR family transcriptional regulator